MAVVLGAGLAVGGLYQASDQAGTSDLCAAELVFDGRTYSGRGEQVRTVRPGEELGTATVPGCGAEVAMVAVAALPGVDPDRAVLADGGVWVAAGGTELPAGVSELSRAVPCTQAGTWTLAGDWVSVQAPPPERDYELTAPFLATIDADTGPGLPLDRFSSVRVEVRVTEATAGGADEQLARAALGGAARIEAEVSCDGADFVARALRVAP